MQQQRLAGLRILLVDDEPDSLEITRVILEAEAALVASASTADEALRMIREQPPDAVLSDIAMPRHDGYWLLRSVRALRPEEGRDVPFAALTAHASAATRDTVLTAGFRLHVPKPAETETLVQAVKTLVGRRERP